MTSYYSENAFLEAWQRGIAIAGQTYFGSGDTSAGAAARKWDLPPRVDDIDHASGMVILRRSDFLGVNGELLQL
jgi:hypothetical protein